MDFEAFFQQATKHPPLPYQARLAEGAWPEVLDIPTGLGKTAAIILAYLFRRLTAPGATPRRLVYCLPMRVLVRQVEQSAKQWCESSQAAFEAAGQPCPTVHVMMGGETDASWDVAPEAPAIIIGTQDLLLSRALNRGYAMSRYKWPVHFALLNNDCLWVLDETQLMGVGVETSAQLQAFRELWGAQGEAKTVWMSATLGRNQLATVDHPEPPERFATHALTPADQDHPLVAKRVSARKRLQQLSGLRVDKDTDSKHAAALAERVLELHQAGTRTLVILNRVIRAQELYAALLKQGRRADDTLLLHSRFRPHERGANELSLMLDGDRIAVATQAVEAGVDLSSRTLVTELAPWSSLVQRFGRCNRYGEHEQADIYWLDIDEEGSRGGCALPYAAGELARTRTMLAGVSEASPGAISKVPYEPPRVIRPVLRRKDLLELFDTSSDLSGNDIDVSRFVRDGDDLDVRIFWRAVDGVPSEDEPLPHRDELCAVSIGQARGFIDALRKHAQKLGCELAWTWKPLDRRWQPLRSGRGLLPSSRVLLACPAGGYQEDLGWTGKAGGQEVAVVPVETQAPPCSSDGDDADSKTNAGRWIPLADHLRHVRDHVVSTMEALDLAPRWRAVLETAAAWHDVGKAHETFQTMLCEGDPERPAPNRETVWAKSSHSKGRAKRKHFRHELGSALIYLQTHADATDADLVTYLIACHHGKVRLSIRSQPGEKKPPEADRLFARGWWDGDTVPVAGTLLLPDGSELAPTPIDLSIMKMGTGSWLERMLRLRDTLGPFCLTYLEAVLRSGDGRASAEERGEAS